MVSTELSESFSEVLYILEHMDKKDVDRIPKKFIDFLNNNKSMNYSSHLNSTKELSEMQLRKKTKEVLAIIYMNYWCTPQQKNDFNRQLVQNEQRYQEELRERYDSSKIFQKDTLVQNKVLDSLSAENNNENISIVESKGSFLGKIITQIKRLLNR